MDKHVIVIVLILLVCFVYLIPKTKKTEQKISYNVTSKESLVFYSRMENVESPKKLTIDQVKGKELFANISDEDAKEIIDGLYSLSIITYNISKYGTGKI